jgi:hypothetical protein
VLVISEYFMFNEWEILARGYCMHVFLVYIRYLWLQPCGNEALAKITRGQQMVVNVRNVGVYRSNQIKCLISIYLPPNSILLYIHFTLVDHHLLLDTMIKSP